MSGLDDERCRRAPSLRDATDLAMDVAVESVDTIGDKCERGSAARVYRPVVFRDREGEIRPRFANGESIGEALPAETLALLHSREVFAILRRGEEHS